MQTIAQRCAHWFMLRQFRITGKMEDDLLLFDQCVSDTLGFECFSTVR